MAHHTNALTPAFSNDEPPFLTPEMMGWYSAVVQPLRGPALSAVTDEFQGTSMSSGTKGVLYEREKDQIEQTKFREIVRERETFFQNKEVAFLRDEIAKKRPDYEAIKTQYGRDALRRKPVFYVVVM